MKCGGSFVDVSFKGWLRRAIGRENFAKLDKENALRPISTHTSESGPMRELMKRFDAKKKTFSNATQGIIRIDLPPPLDGLNVEGRVRDGELTIHPQEMGNIFKYCVNKVVELIDDLAERVTMDNSRRIKVCTQAILKRVYQKQHSSSIYNCDSLPLKAIRENLLIQ